MTINATNTGEREPEKFDVGESHRTLAKRELPENTPEEVIDRRAAKLAQNHHFNEIIGLRAMMENIEDRDRGITDESLRAELRSGKWGWRPMQPFTEKYPPAKHPKLIEHQPPGVVERLDAIAHEVNALIASETITVARANELIAEMAELTRR